MAPTARGIAADEVLCMKLTKLGTGSLPDTGGGPLRVIPYLFVVPQHDHVSPPTYLSEGLASAPPTPAFYRQDGAPRAGREPETWTLPLAMRRLPRPRWRPKRRPWRCPSMRPPLHPSRGSTMM